MSIFINRLLLALITASAAGTMLFVMVIGLKPITGRLFSNKWNYYISFMPVFFLLGGVEIVNSIIRFAALHLGRVNTTQTTHSML